MLLQSVRTLFNWCQRDKSSPRWAGAEKASSQLVDGRSILPTASEMGNKMRWTFDPLGSRGSLINRRLAAEYAAVPSQLTSAIAQHAASSALPLGGHCWPSHLSPFCHPPQGGRPTTGVARPVRGLGDANLRCFGENANNEELAVKEIMGCARETDSVPDHPDRDS